MAMAMRPVMLTVLLVEVILQNACAARVLNTFIDFYSDETGNAHNTTPNTTDNTSHTHGTTTASAEQTTASATPSLNWSVRCRSSRPAASAASSAVKKALKLFSSASSFAK